MKQTRSKRPMPKERSNITYLDDCGAGLYTIKVMLKELEDNPKMCSLCVKATTNIDGAYITQLNIILSAMGLTGRERFAKDSTFIISRSRANKLYNMLCAYLDDTIWCEQLLKEIKEDREQGWEAK